MTACGQFPVQVIQQDVRQERARGTALGAATPTGAGGSSGGAAPLVLHHWPVVRSGRALTPGRAPSGASRCTCLPTKRRQGRHRAIPVPALDPHGPAGPPDPCRAGLASAGWSARGLAPFDSPGCWVRATADPSWRRRGGYLPARGGDGGQGKCVPTCAPSGPARARLQEQVGMGTGAEGLANTRAVLGPLASAIPLAQRAVRLPAPRLRGCRGRRVGQVERRRIQTWGRAGSAAGGGPGVCGSMAPLVRVSAPGPWPQPGAGRGGSCPSGGGASRCRATCRRTGDRRSCWSP